MAELLIGAIKADEGVVRGTISADCVLSGKLTTSFPTPETRVIVDENGNLDLPPNTSTGVYTLHYRGVDLATVKLSDTEIVSEDFKQFVDRNTVITDIPTDSVIWNGTPTKNWTAVPNSGKSILVVHPTEGVNGSKCVAITLDGTAERQSRMSINYRLGAPLYKGCAYVLKLKAKKSPDLDTSVRFQTQYKSEAGNPAKTLSSITTEWQEFTHEFVPEGTMKDFILVLGTGYGTTGTAYFDDVSLTMKGNGAEMIIDGDFENFTACDKFLKENNSGTIAQWNGMPTNKWSATRQSGSGMLIVHGNEGRDGGKCVSITLTGDESRLSILYNHRAPLVLGKTYVLKLMAKRSEDLSASTAVLVQPQYKTSGNPRKTLTGELTTEWKEFSYEFTAEGTLKDLVIQFSAGVAATGTVYFDDVSLTLKDDSTELITDGGFEGCTAFDSTLYESDSETVVHWNGAKPTSEWSVQCREGSAILQPNVDSNGNVHMSITPSAGCCRMLLTYTFPKKIYESLEEGMLYTVYADFKFSPDADFNARIEGYGLTDDGIYTSCSQTEEWKTFACNFYYKKGSTTPYIDFGIDVAGGTKGTLYIDNIRMV